MILVPRILRILVLEITSVEIPGPYLNAGDYEFEWAVSDLTEV